MISELKMARTFKDYSQLLEDQTLGYAAYYFTETKVINILMVGRSQSGKTTIIDTLKNPHVCATSRGFSDTREGSLHSLVLRDQSHNLIYQVNIIDTPGLKESRFNISRESW